MKLFGILIITQFLIACAGPGVIGVAYNQEGIVRYVFKNSPAEKAGIITGDKILNTKNLRGKIDTMCLVKFERKGTFFEKLVKRINIDNLENEQYGKW